MRIISGSAGGVKLEALKGKTVRPTTDRVRESLFNILMPRLDDCRFLDLYAGTGANGIEALSRNGAYSVFVDGSRDATDLIERNLRKTGLEDRARILLKSLPDGLESVANSEESFDVIFADPPYDYPAFASLLTAIVSVNLIKVNGLVVLEHHKNKTIDDVEGGLRIVRTKKYGDTVLSFFQIT